MAFPARRTLEHAKDSDGHLIIREGSYELYACGSPSNCRRLNLSLTQNSSKGFVASGTIEDPYFQLYPLTHLIRTPSHFPAFSWSSNFASTFGTLSHTFSSTMICYLGLMFIEYIIIGSKTYFSTSNVKLQPS